MGVSNGHINFSMEINSYYMSIKLVYFETRSFEQTYELMHGISTYLLLIHVI